jgi:2-oxoisovalerate dehydrogenase E1 component
VNGRVSIFLEPIALYMTKDLHQNGDGLWSFAYPPPEHAVPIGSARTWGNGGQLTIISYANGLWMSLRVAERLKARGIHCRVVDLRWLNPLPVADLLREARATGRVLIVDECRVTGGMAEGVIAALVDSGSALRIRRIAGRDTYIPLGDAANRVLVQEEDIWTAALALVEPA